MFPVFVPVFKKGKLVINVWQNHISGNCLQDQACRESHKLFQFPELLCRTFANLLCSISVWQRMNFSRHVKDFCTFYLNAGQIKRNKQTENVPSCYDWQWRYQESCVCLHLHCVRVEGFGWLDSGENHLNVGATEVITATAVLVIETKGDGRR